MAKDKLSFAAGTHQFKISDGALVYRGLRTEDFSIPLKDIDEITIEKKNEKKSTVKYVGGGIVLQEVTLKNAWVERVKEFITSHPDWIASRKHNDQVKNLGTIERIIQKWRGLTSQQKGFSAMAAAAAGILLLAAIGSSTPSVPAPEEPASAVVTTQAAEKPKPVISEKEEVKEEVKVEPLALATVTGELRAHYIDVGQGDSAFIELPNGQTMLIDAGPQSAGSTVVSYVRGLGYSKIDYLLATHPHEDHIGGIPAVLTAFEVGEIWAPKVSHTTKTYENFLDAVALKGMQIRTAEVGKTIIDGENLTFDILSPSPATLMKSSASDLNIWSVISLLTYGDTTFLFTGDAPKEAITTASGSQSVDVLKVGHHGSNTSTSAALITKLSPTLAVIPVGNNSYGHPTPGTLEALRDLKVFRTDQQGTIIITSDGKTVSADKESAQYAEPAAEKPVEKKETPPPAQAQAVDDPVVFITNTGAKYHRDGCRHLKSRIETTLSAAKAQGLEACKVCGPPQ